jgi:hypothetical protein
MRSGCCRYCFEKQPKRAVTRGATSVDVCAHGGIVVTDGCARQRPPQFPLHPYKAPYFMTPNATLQRRAACGPSAARACWTADRYGPQYRRHQPGGADEATSRVKECQQIGVELVFVRGREAVGCARVDL